MDPIISIVPVLAILASGIAVPLIVASRNNPNQREFWSFLAAVVKFGLIMSMVPVIYSGQTIEYSLISVLPGIELKFRVDALGLAFATTASFLWIVTTAYSIGYMRTLKEREQTRYFACFAIALFSAIGVAFAANLFTLFLFYEILSIMTYPLVAHNEDAAGLEGGKKYLVYLVGAAKIFLLAAIVLTYKLTGTLDFAKGGIFTSEMPALLVMITYICFLAGFAKAGIMPLHNWLPSAMVAPTPVSALLHAVAVVKVGVFSVVRIIFDVMGIDIMSDLNLGIPTAFFVSFTIIMASVIALTKDDLKARLAYSTVSQLSYIILGVAILTPDAMMGGILHIANHAVSKITLFFCAGAIYASSHLKKISMMGGLGRKMPLTMIAFTVGAFSMIGVPAFAGFTSKWYMAVGAIDAGTSSLMFVLLASTVLNAAYFLPVIIMAFFGKEHPDSHMHEVKEAPLFCLIPLLITAVLTVVVAIWPGYFMGLAEMVVK